MPIQNYSVLTGHPSSGKVMSGSSAHYDITVQVKSSPYAVAVNIQSVDGSEVLYAILNSFTPPDPDGLSALASGMTTLSSEPNGLALDFVRETIAGQPMITREQMTTLPIASDSAQFFREALAFDENSRILSTHALQNAVVQLLNQAVADPGSTIYAFGSAYADRGVVDGIHDIHMNQGNPSNNHGSDNGIWQDGALFLNLPEQSAWIALFIAFQTESWSTDDGGDPI